MNKYVLIILVFSVISLAIGIVLVMSGAISFNPTNVTPKCIVAGCSGELCIDENDSTQTGISICIWSDKFACYKKTTCEVQQNGKCGWTENEEFNQCIAETDNSPAFIGY